MMTRMTTIPEGAKDTHRSTFNHVFTAMLLSLLFGIGWAFGFIASSNVSRDAYLTTQYLFSFLILTHTILQMILYLLYTHVSQDELRYAWYRVTGRAKGFDVTEPVNERRSSKYLSNSPESNVEGIDLEERDEKKPIDDTDTSQPTGTNDETAMQSPVGAANQLADDQDAVTTYTNKEAMEPSDEHDNTISSF